MAIHSIVILGSGNVATHVGIAMKQAGFSIVGVYSRDLQNATLLANQLGTIPYSQLDLVPTTADLYLIAVKDSAIHELANQLPMVNGLVVHTSGTTSLHVLANHKHIGVFYPLQSLSKNAQVAVTDIPLLIEAKHENDLVDLQKLSQQIGFPFYSVNSDDRKTVHLAAVFANNFTNYLYAISEQIVSDKGLSFDILKPLIIETARKVQQHKPAEVQTGPALRNDVPTINMHLQLLEQFPQYQKIYEWMSKGIQEG